MPALTSPARLHLRGSSLLVGLLLAIGFVALTIAPAEAARHQVKIEQYAYGPSSLNVTQGDTVTWTNLDSVEHDVVVTSGPESFRSPLLSKGESWSHTFTSPGSYSYICSLHPDMRAAVAAAPVAAPPTSAAPTPTPTPTPTPQTAPSVAPSARHTSATPTGKRSTTSETPAPAPSAAAPTPPPVTTAAPASNSTLNPLLLVAGASVAVMVFCLLLMASRPVYQQSPGSPDADEEP
jgi:plastocyanin